MRHGPCDLMYRSMMEILDFNVVRLLNFGADGLASLVTASRRHLSFPYHLITHSAVKPISNAVHNEATCWRRQDVVNKV